jgi:hypothetical protein
MASWNLGRAALLAVATVLASASPAFAQGAPPGAEASAPASHHHHAKGKTAGKHHDKLAKPNAAKGHSAARPKKPVAKHPKKPTK